MAKYFTYSEFTKSTKADSLGIDNIPKEEKIQDNILELMHVMDIIRDGWTYICEENCWDSPAIVITSGYRCNALNQAVGGSDTSAHKIGSACDFKAQNGRNKELLEYAHQVLITNCINWDQLINEKPDSYGKPSWIHLGLRNNKNQQRKQYKTLC